MTDSIVTHPDRSFDHIDTDVYNMSRWGIDFRDADYRFTDWSTETEGILGYIHLFERMETEPNIGAPEPSPIFWATWHDSVPEVNREGNFRLDWDSIDNRHYEPLADWEWELLGSYGTVGWNLWAACNSRLSTHTSDFLCNTFIY